MQRIVILVLLASLLAACGGAGNSLTAEDLVIVDHVTEGRIGFGMNKAEVDAILGNSEKDANGLFEVYKDGLRVAYRDHTVVGFILGEGSEKRYSTTRNLRVGSLREEWNKNYGSFFMNDEEGRNNPMSFTFVQRDGKYYAGPIHDDDIDIGYVYSVNTGYTAADWDTIQSVLIADYRFAVYMR